MRTKTALIVDDHPEVLSFMGAALGRSSYNVLTADSAVAALNVVRSNPQLDIVISEATLSKGDGIQLLETVQESLPGVSVMLTTSDIAVPQAPFIPYLLKPFTAQTLVARVNDLLGKSQHARQPMSDALEQSFGSFEPIAVGRMKTRNVVRRSRQVPRQSRTGSTRFKPAVLLVEEDAIYRYAVSHYLSQHGFTVLDTADPVEAAGLLREYRDRISLVLTAVQDAESAREVESDYPEKPIVFMTNGETSLPYPALQKPFELEDLLAFVLRTLERQQTCILSPDI